MNPSSLSATENIGIIQHINDANPSKIDKKEPYNSELEAPQAQMIIRRFGFSISKELNLLVPEGLYCELIVDINIAPLPYTPPHVAGLLNLRGNIISVYGINEFIGEGPSSRRYAYLIGKPSDGAAIFIKDKPNVVDIANSQSVECSSLEVPDKLSTCIDTSYDLNGIQWHALNPKKLFGLLSEQSE